MSGTQPVNVLVLLPAKARQVVYIGYGLLALADSSVLVAYASISATLPRWLIAATAVIVFLGVPVQSLAAMNIARAPAESGQQVAANWEAAHERQASRVLADPPPEAKVKTPAKGNANGDGRDDTTGRFVAKPTD